MSDSIYGRLLVIRGSRVELEAAGGSSTFGTFVQRAINVQFRELKFA
jgi:hypothetical protein